MHVEIDISKLSVGTYIEKITKQTGDYTLKEPNWVKSDTTIAKLKAMGVQRILTDPSKFRQPMNSPVTLSAENQAQLTVNLSQAKALLSSAKSIQKKLFKNIEDGVDIDLAPIKLLTEELVDTVFDNADALMCTINLRNKDEYLLEHSFSVSILITLFAHYLGIDKAISQELTIGAFLHDVGKIKIPNEVLQKPGRLSSAEFEIIKSHVNHSVNIIKSISGIAQQSLEIASLHHEKLNGQGYPNGVSGNQISKYGRMLSICDIYDALTANRCYKDGYSQVKAFNILRSLGMEEQLDFDLVNVFIKCMGVYPVGSLVKLDSNRLAIVERGNQQDSIRPRVNAFYNLTEKKFEAAKHIDLSEQSDDKIVQSVRADDFDLDMEEIMRFLESES